MRNYFDKRYFSTLNEPKEKLNYMYNALGEYYKESGFKFTKSKRMISWKSEKLSHCLIFGTLSTNVLPENVWFEINGANWMIGKEKEGALRFMLERLKPRQGQTDRIVIDFDGSERHYKLKENEKPYITMAKGCNIYALDEKGFESIIRYTNKLIDTMNSLDTSEGIEKYLHGIPDDVYSYMLHDIKTKDYIYDICGFEEHTAEEVFEDLIQRYGEAIDWEPVSFSNKTFVAELKREIGENDPLYDKEIYAVAKRGSNDDVLFVTGYENDADIYRIYHLTYSKNNAEGFPRYKEFKGIKAVKLYIVNEFMEENENE